MASVCGICHKNMIANSTQASTLRSPRAATQPITGGNAPGTAPTGTHNELTRFIGV